jgi:hypothetical protein
MGEGLHTRCTDREEGIRRREVVFDCPRLATLARKTAGRRWCIMHLCEDGERNGTLCLL